MVDVTLVLSKVPPVVDAFEMPEEVPGDCLPGAFELHLPQGLGDLRQFVLGHHLILAFLVDVQFEFDQL